MRVLLVRTSALGDVVHTLPALVALRSRYPQARLGWVVEEAFAPLLAAHAALDEVIPVATRRWRRDGGAARREIPAAVGALRRFAPDVALDVMGNHKGGLLTRLSGARRRIGARRSDRREPSSAAWINEPTPVAGTHAVDRTLSLLAPLDAVPAVADFAPDRLLPGAVPSAGTPAVLLHPGAGWANKVYPPALWAEVLRRLGAATGLPTGVLVGPGTEEPALAIASEAGARTVAADDLPCLIAALRGARLVLGGDSGPLHLAHALGTPVLALMGPTDPARHGPYGAPDRALAKRLPCSYCYRRLDETKACLLELAPQEVADRALVLLAAADRSGGRPAP